MRRPRSVSPPGAGARVRRIEVPAADAGERLDRFLSRTLPAMPARVRALVAAGRIRIRGRACSPHRHLFGGEAIEVRLPEPAPVRPRAAGRPALTVLHDAGGVLVVDKPAGLPVEPGGPNAPGVTTAAAGLGRFDVDGRALPGLPHRIDRDTSGCLMLARDDRALEALRQAFARGEVEKEYLALVAGAPPEEGALDTPYARDPRDPRRFTTRVASARRARLRFRVERRLPCAALLRVRLETGRTHQIRVQLADAGWPVLGDAVYGRPSPAIGRQALHAARLAFPSPAGTGRVEVVAPLPADMERAVRSLASGVAPAPG
jgi:23S rRNA pseudouridine1911/1915/1917 synthase